MVENDADLEAFGQAVADGLSTRLGAGQAFAHQFDTTVLLVQFGGGGTRLQLCERIEEANGASCRLWGADLSRSVLVQHFDSVGVQAQLSRDGLKSLGEYFALALADANAALSLEPPSVIQTGAITEAIDGEKHGVAEVSFKRIGKMQLLVEYKNLLGDNSVSTGHFDLNILQDDVHISAWEMMYALFTTTSKTNDIRQGLATTNEERQERPRKKTNTQSTQQSQTGGSRLVFPTSR